MWEELSDVCSSLKNSSWVLEKVDSSCVGQSNYGEKYYSENGLLMLENLPEIL